MSRAGAAAADGPPDLESPAWSPQSALLGDLQRPEWSPLAGLADPFLASGRGSWERQASGSSEAGASWERRRRWSSWLAFESIAATTEPAFIRSEVNGRRSRRIVLLAFYCTDVIGALLWASWCQGRSFSSPGRGGEGFSDAYDTAHACRSFGVNHFAVFAASLPVEGVILMGAGSNPWSIWSDGLLLPVWFIRLILFDVLLWDVSPPVLVGDALWFSVMAVMCRVHSLALAALVACQVGSLFLIFGMKGLFSFDDFSTVRFGMYSVTMLIIVACAYFLDEQSRLQSFGQLTSLEDRNARLADQLLRWKFIPGPGGGPPADQTPHGHAYCGSGEDDVSRRDSSASSARSILRRGGAGAAGQAGLERAGLSVRFSTPDQSALVQTSRPRSGSFLVREQATPLNLHDVME